jgi:hypothetical protein
MIYQQSLRELSAFCECHEASLGHRSAFTFMAPARQRSSVPALHAVSRAQMWRSAYAWMPRTPVPALLPASACSPVILAGCRLIGVGEVCDGRRVLRRAGRTGRS